MPATARGRRSRTPGSQKWVAVVACAIVALIVLVVGLASTDSGPQLPPGAQTLYYADYQAGACLRGDLPNTSAAAWPDPVLQVPCTYPHTDEVFYANASFWPVSASYPGAEVITADSAQQCDTQFLQYVGVPPEESIYNYVDFAPDAQTWQGGDRELACVAYAVTDAQPNGAVLWTSIKGSAV